MAPERCAAKWNCDVALDAGKIVVAEHPDHPAPADLEIAATPDRAEPAPASTGDLGSDLIPLDVGGCTLIPVAVAAATGHIATAPTGDRQRRRRRLHHRPRKVRSEAFARRQRHEGGGRDKQFAHGNSLCCEFVSAAAPGNDRTPGAGAPPHELRKSQSRRVALTDEVSLSRGVHAYAQRPHRSALQPRFQPANTCTNPR